MNAPCKDCKERTLGCHSKWEKYIAFDRENQKRREERVVNSSAAKYSPNKRTRVRHYEINKMRGVHK